MCVCHSPPAVPQRATGVHSHWAGACRGVPRVPAPLPPPLPHDAAAVPPPQTHPRPDC